MKHSRVDVTIHQGCLRGIVEDNIHGGYYIAFRGIPYGKPPVGELRFKDPLPAESWSDVRDASQFGHIAPQMNLFTVKTVGNEDCLYLNVYTPSIEPQMKRAVMVWVHGGGFLFGSGNDDVYGPDHIVRKDVVLVTLNYRLGVFGFLHLDDEVVTGNQGLKDIVMALRWVQKNISNFGGNPENVTIFGQSAGGALVHHLTLSPLTNGLYHKVIAQSGLAVNAWALNESTKKSFLLVEKLGKQTSDPKIAYEFLKTINMKKLIEIQPTLTSSAEAQRFEITLVPNPDHKSPNPFFRQHPDKAISLGVKVPLLLGFTSREGSFFQRKSNNSRDIKQTDSDFKRYIHAKILAALKQQSISIEALRLQYFGNKPVPEETQANRADLITDLYFRRGVYELADIQIRIGNPSTYMYKFSYDSEVSIIKTLMNIELPGATHAEELLYLFYPYMSKTFNINLMERDPKEHRISDQLTQMWTDFAKTGNPTPAVTDLIPITWTPLESGNVFNYLNIDSELKMETVRKEEQLNWNNIKHKL